MEGSHLVISSNLQLLDAEFTDSQIPNQIGKTPAFAPDVVYKGAITFRKDNCYSFRLSATAVSSQFFQDSNLPAVAGGVESAGPKSPPISRSTFPRNIISGRIVAYSPAFQISPTKNITIASSPAECTRSWHHRIRCRVDRFSDWRTSRLTYRNPEGKRGEEVPARIPATALPVGPAVPPRFST